MYYNRIFAAWSALVIINLNKYLKALKMSKV